MSYNKELETDKEAKRAYDKRMKENAAARLKGYAEWKRNRKNKREFSSEV
jgi:hypothetical protein